MDKKILTINRETGLMKEPSSFLKYSDKHCDACLNGIYKKDCSARVVSDEKTKN